MKLANFEYPSISILIARLFTRFVVYSVEFVTTKQSYKEKLKALFAAQRDEAGWAHSQAIQKNSHVTVVWHPNGMCSEGVVPQALQSWPDSELAAEVRAYQYSDSAVGHGTEPRDPFKGYSYPAPRANKLNPEVTFSRGGGRKSCGNRIEYLYST